MNYEIGCLTAETLKSLGSNKIVVVEVDRYMHKYLKRVNLAQMAKELSVLPAGQIDIRGKRKYRKRLILRIENIRWWREFWTTWSPVFYGTVLAAISFSLICYILTISGFSSIIPSKSLLDKLFIVASWIFIIGTAIPIHGHKTMVAAATFVCASLSIAILRSYF